MHKFTYHLLKFNILLDNKIIESKSKSLNHISLGPNIHIMNRLFQWITQVQNCNSNSEISRFPSSKHAFNYLDFDRYILWMESISIKLRFPNISTHVVSSLHVWLAAILLYQFFFNQFLFAPSFFFSTCLLISSWS